MRDLYRLLFLNYNLIAALKREKGFWVDDGKNTVDELIDLSLTSKDVISTDINYNSYYVLEINKEPALDFHHNPDYGESIDVATKIVNAVRKQYTN